MTKQRTKKMEVELKADPNPDYDAPEHRATVRIQPSRHDVGSLKDASHTVCRFIQTNDLGGGNFTGGRVFDDSGKVIARVSYNGRVWDNGNNEIQI